MKFLLLVSLFSTFCLNNAGALFTYYMDNNCNGTLDMSYLDSIRLKLTSRSAYMSNMDCYLLLTSTYKSLDRFMLYFKDFNIESNIGCTRDWLEVHDGNRIYSPYLSGISGRQCGYYMSSTVRTTSGNNLFLRFRSDGSWQEKGFNMVITQYHTGICSDGEFSCDNGRCISYGLVCNGYNPCGDYSDCDSTLAAGVIVGIILGSVGFTICLFTILLVVRQRRRRRLLHRPVNVVATTTTNYGTGYNQSVQQQYPQVSYPTGQQYPTPQYPNQPYPN